LTAATNAAHELQAIIARQTDVKHCDVEMISEQRRIRGLRACHVIHGESGRDERTANGVSNE
jgi:hypothetical protein